MTGARLKGRRRAEKWQGAKSEGSEGICALSPSNTVREEQGREGGRERGREEERELVSA